jgi:hypothetical protein
MIAFPVRLPRPDLSESSIVSVADSSESDSASTVASGSVDDSMDSVIDSMDSSSSAELNVPSMHTRPRPVAPVPLCNDWYALSGTRGVAEYAWQTAGRAANAAAFVLLASADPGALRPIAAMLSALTAGYCGYRLIRAKTGDETCAQKLAVALGTAASAAAGGVATAYGWAAPGLAIGTAGIISAALACGASATAVRPTCAADTVIPAVFVASSGASLTLMAFVPSLRMIVIDKLPRRSLALMAEAMTTEFFKSSTERTLPRLDRESLAFERKLTGALMGLLPYALASVGLNGALGNLLRAQLHSDRYEDLLIPMLVGALANVVKGAVNTALLCHSAGTRATVQAPECPSLPDRSALMAKTALRYVIAHARDVLYVSLVEHGMNDMAAACTAYALYALFAQHRDLLFDLMNGEGWSEPQLTAREAVSPGSHAG